MKFLREIKDEKIDKKQTNLKIRKAVRAVLFDSHNLMPILFVSKENYYKLPGGGIEKNENNRQALKREIKEETGCKIEVSAEIGKIIEFRPYKNLVLKQISYCYLGKITEKGKTAFTEKEIKNGFQLIWISLDEAIKKFEKENPNNKEGLFILERDLTFLKEAKKLKD